MTTITRRKPTAKSKKQLDLDALVESFKKFRAAKNAESAAKKEHEKLRDEVLMPALIDFGQPHGDKGQHLAIPLPDGVEIDGLRTLVRRRGVSRFINIDRAEALATKGKFLPEIQAGAVTFTFTGTPAEAKKIAGVLRRAGMDEYGDITHIDRFSQERLMAFHQRHRDRLTEAELDSLFDEDVSYSFHPEK